LWFPHHTHAGWSCSIERTRSHEPVSVNEKLLFFHINRKCSASESERRVLFCTRWRNDIHSHSQFSILHHSIHSYPLIDPSIIFSKHYATTIHFLVKNIVTINILVQDHIKKLCPALQQNLYCSRVFTKALGTVQTWYGLGMATRNFLLGNDSRFLFSREVNFSIPTFARVT
jgi:hypothetical protein